MKKLLLVTLAVIALVSTVDYSRTAGHVGIGILVGVMIALWAAHLATQ
ncbi:hypothetical protein [Nocardia sp. alder85J]|nr:hypothetical protein [Nocardia sp. alder85J]MCX4097101.1 hypothetical protein [Nocardia sp. alder85J]